MDERFPITTDETEAEELVETGESAGEQDAGPAGDPGDSAAEAPPVPRALRFVEVDRELDPDFVTQEEVRDVYDGDHPDDELRGQEYVALSEERGAVTFHVTLEAVGFEAGDRVQLDIGTGDGYRAAEVVDVPAGNEPQTFAWLVGPAPAGRIGAPIFMAFEVSPGGAVGRQLARLDAA